LSYKSPTITGQSLPEHLIIIRRGEYAARIMHVSPEVNEGDSISNGDIIGRTITNGFFSYWADPAIHVEVRRCGDFLRPLGGFKLRPASDIKIKSMPIEEAA